MTGVFEVVAKQMDDEAERNEGTRARIAAKARVEERFAKYISAGTTKEERADRLSFVAAHVRQVVGEVAEEYGYEKVAELHQEMLQHLAGGAFCDDCKKFQCECGDDDSEDTKESSTKTADHGDSYHTETVDLGTTTSDEAWSQEGSPAINKSQVPEDGLDAIDVPSKRHPTEQQSVTKAPTAEELATADHAESDVATRVDADTPMQPEFTQGEGGTWSGTDGQATPVTSSVEAKWSVTDGR